MGCFARVSETLRQDRGASLPEVIVSVVISAITMGAIATGVISLVQLNTTVGGVTAAASATQVTETRWRSDVRSALNVTATDADRVSFAVPGPSGRCLDVMWVLGDSGLTAVTTVHPEFGETGCAGAPVSTTEETLVRAPGDQAGFTYANAAGRPIVFVAGTPVAAVAVKPETVDQAAWDSTTVRLATLTSRVLAGTEYAADVRASQILDSLGAGNAGPAPAPATFVLPVVTG